MPEMVDPTDGLVSFQQALRAGAIDLQRGALDRKIFVHADNPAPGQMRLTYVRLQGQTVTAFVVAAPAEFYEGLPCFQLGVAVPEQYRRQGRAKELMQAAIREMQNGLGRAGIPEFYIEAVVHVDNVASQRVAQSTINAEPIDGVDGHSGEPILQYLAKIQGQAS